MIKKIRILVVDDSAFMRKYISDILNKEKDMEVIGTASNGENAIRLAKLLKPDVITLDVEMPGKNGLEILEEIKENSSAEIIMLSSYTQKGSIITIEALRMGAFDYIEKPSGSFQVYKMKQNLIEKVRHAFEHKRKKQSLNLNIAKTAVKEKHSRKIEAIALGASTGGPKVLFSLITKLPRDIDVPIFVVQHMPSGFTKAFAERLNANSRIAVVEARNEERIKSGVVYIAPGGYHMMINSNKIILDTSAPVHGVRPSVDKLFISAAKVFKDRLLGCIFTGMGKDGAEGIKEIKKNGGLTIAQDESTSVIYGMPKAAYETGCVDFVLPDYQITEEIIRLIRKNNEIIGS